MPVRDDDIFYPRRIQPEFAKARFDDGLSLTLIVQAVDQDDSVRRVHGESGHIRGADIVEIVKDAGWTRRLPLQHIFRTQHLHGGNGELQALRSRGVAQKQRPLDRFPGGGQSGGEVRLGLWLDDLALIGSDELAAGGLLFG